MNEKGVLRLKEGEHPWGSREDSLCKLLGQIAAGPFPSGILGFKCFKIPRLVGGGRRSPRILGQRRPSPKHVQCLNSGGGLQLRPGQLSRKQLDPLHHPRPPSGALSSFSQLRQKVVL